MALGEEDVIALAREAVDLLAPDIEIQVAPEDEVVGSGWVVWPLVDGHASFGVTVEADMSPAGAVSTILEAINENVAETARFWGQSFPVCPGHRHAAHIAAVDIEDGAVVTFTCPVSGAEVTRTVITE